MKKLPQAPLRTGFIKFRGGLDTESPPLEAVPGTCRDSQNLYQGVDGGYKTHRGYERFDGKTSPSESAYSILVVSEETLATAGDTVTDGTSSGLIIAVEGGTSTILIESTILESSTLLTGTKYLVLTNMTGSISAGPLYVLGLDSGEALAASTVGGAASPDLDAYYTGLAIAAARDAILPPDGAGSTLGGKYYKGNVYVFRNAEDGLSARLWKSTVSGWTEVPLGAELDFTSGGTYTVAEGDVITGATSGKTATVGRVVLSSGTWAGGDAAGRMIILAQTGAFQSENINVGSNLNVMSIAGDSAAITLSPDGQFDIIEANFTSNPETSRLYGCDGVNRGWEFDGTTFVPIDTGMSADSPDYVCAHLNHLFFSFDGSIQNSDISDPYGWTPYLGADEIGLGDRVTGFINQPGSDGSPVLGVFTRNSINMLYGTSRDDWQLIPFRYEAGAIAGSARLLGQTFSLDTRGITTLGASQSFGNFSFSTVSNRIKRWIDTRINSFKCSCVRRGENLYCLFFANGDALYCTTAVGNSGAVSVTSMMPQVFPVTVEWIDSSEDTSGEEVVFFGGSDGYVYQMDQGTSFDGEDIEWYGHLHYVNFKSPNTEKKWRRCTSEMNGEGFSTFWFNYTLEYESGDVEQPLPYSVETNLEAPRFDSAYFDAAYFDGKATSPESFELCGNSTNISLAYGGGSADSSQLTLNGALILYSLTRERR